MTARTISPELVEARRTRLRKQLAASGHEALIAFSPANVDYASGYRSVGAAVHGMSTIAVILTADRMLLAGPVADSAPAFDFGIPETDFLAYGRFFFESIEGDAVATGLVEQNPGFAEAVAAAVKRLGLESARIGVDDRGCPEQVREALPGILTGATLEPASVVFDSARARKLPGEVALIEQAALITERAIIAGLEKAAVGVTEGEIARVVAGSMVAEGAEPRFVVVTSGPRSALADAYATDRALESGDLLRFDVGGVYQGYWSDLGRTAVIGEPSPRQRDYYAAMLAGEDAQFELARPGVVAEAVFNTAITVVEENGGPVPYRRQHCGHGIGLEVYEAPIIRPGEQLELEEGMTFCFETPYYELGWGGMMVEDTLVVTDDGVRVFTQLARGLTVVTGAVEEARR